VNVPGNDAMEDTSGVSRAAFDFIDEIERMSDRRSLMARLDSELKHGFHAWLITGLPNPGGRIDPLMMLNGWP
jgi:LuxR family quorum sensing-dependent transcriptional regulator